MSSIALDRIGGVASASCAMHCLVLSVAPALLTLLGIEFLATEALEWGLFAAAVVFALAAAGLGYRVHRSAWVLVAFGTGVLVLVAGRLGEAFALYEGAGILAIAGGLLLVASHVMSSRRTLACRKACCS